MLEFTERILYRAYILALLLGVLVFAGSPLHRLGTHHADISRVLPENRIEVQTTTAGLEVGDPVPVFRFNPDWKLEIGYVIVETLSETGFEASFDPATFHWPMGLQGTVIAQQGDRIELNIGREMGLGRGQTLNIFRDRLPTGTLRIEEAGTGHSVALLTDGTAPVGAVATRFTVANQVSWFHSPAILAAEWVLLISTLGLWLWAVFSRTPGQVIARIRQRCLSTTVPEPVRLGALALLGLPIVPALTQFTWYTLGRLVEVGTGWLSESPIVLTPWDGPVLAAGYALGAVLWVLTLVRSRRNPLAVLWTALRFRPPEANAFSPLTRGHGIWILHLLVFYAFGSTLTSFLKGNLRAMLKLGWPDAGVPIGGITDILPALAHILTHLPELADVGEAFTLARLGLWSLTICGCLLGYGHTLLSILWKPEPIRNIDFTAVGWATNALCYGPLLGVVFYRMTGNPNGVDPGISEGLWWYLQLSTEFLLNLLYTLSIWNLGTRFGVMVDKGVQDRGFYSFVRHPSYTLEGWMFIVLGLSSATTPLHYLIALGWPLKYFLRSERDDTFMGASNPDYVAYRDKVNWKYYPGIW